MSNCNCHNDDLRDGSAQFSRYLKALDPSYAPIDDRSMEELLVFIKNYAARIRFYDLPESELGQEEEASWQEFFSRDMAVVLASVTLTDVAEIKKNYEDIRDQLEETGEEELLSKAFTASIDIAKKINEWYLKAIPENPLNNELKTVIQSFLGNQIQKIMAYEEGYRLVFVPGKMNLEYHNLEHNALWGTDKEIFADISIFEGTTTEEKLMNAALYADEIFNSFLGSLHSLVEKSGIFLKFALEEYPGHQPHMALFISFLKLFRLAQNQMNELPGRMLDYYYKDVLRLTPKNSLPDKVHIVFELAKEVMEYDLEKETALKAGKDDLGIEQLYMTEESLVVNQVKVKEIKTVYIEKVQSSTTEVAKLQKDIIAVYANPEANSSDGVGTPFDSDYTAWPTFGKSEIHKDLPGPLCEALKILHPSEEVKNSVQIGFAIASPQLLLQGGNRLVMIESDSFKPLFGRENFMQIENHFEIKLSGENGWIKVVQERPWLSINELMDEDGQIFKQEVLEIDEPFYSLELEGEQKKIALFIPLSAEGIINFNRETHPGQTFDTSNPVLQVLLHNQFPVSEIEFQSISFQYFSLNVKVGSMGIIKESEKASVSLDGLKYLILQNENQLIETGKSFDPFTATPFYGKSFYIGSEEVFNKRLQELSINIRTAGELENSFHVNLYLLRNKKWIDLNLEERKNGFSILNLTNNVLNEKVIKLLHQRIPVHSMIDYNLNTTNGFLRMDLIPSTTTTTPTSNYSRVLRENLEIKEISLSYNSQSQGLQEGIDQFFHVYPFGVAEISLTPEKYDYDFSENPEAGLGGYRSKMSKSAPIIIRPNPNLLPQFTFTDLYKNASSSPPAHQMSYEEESEDYYPRIISAIKGMSDHRGKINQYSGKVQEEGILFIGLENAKPLQSVSLLFQFAPGSAADEDQDPPKIHWSYLVYNEWVPMIGESIVADETNGFQSTGIIKFALPKDITDRSTIITDGLSWIRASVTENAERIPRLINIYAQAVTAIFRDSANSPAHYEKALKADTINKLLIPVAQISKVLQPFSSFDGKHAEVGVEFQTRTSERLRHKQRAITAWDYEHLILERFPEIFKVKCITNTDPNCLCREKHDEGGVRTDCCGPQVAPGHILLVPIANLKNRNAVNRLQPRTSQRELIAMTQYAKKFASPFVKIFAKNPVYEQVIVFFKVQFIPGTDKGYFLKKLNDAIVEFLTPWAFHEDADVVFGQKIYASSIIDFIEERPYVDFITDFEMGVCKEDCCPEEKNMNTEDRTALESIKAFTNCQDVENVFNQINGFSGDIVVAPSTSRSLLVSAPRHFIFPYEAPLVYSICEQRKRKQMGTADFTDNIVFPADNVKVVRHPAGNGKDIVNEGKISAEDSLKQEAKTTVIDSIKKMEEVPVKVSKVAVSPQIAPSASPEDKISTSPVKKIDALAIKKAAPVKKQVSIKKSPPADKAKTKKDNNKDDVK